MSGLPISVLYIHPCGIFGGASRSLLELVKAFPPDGVNPHLLTQAGSTVDFFREHGVPVISLKGISQLDNTQYGYYRGARWLIVLRELLYYPFTLYGMLKARNSWPDIDILHINEVTLLVPLLPIKLLFGKPLVVHVRSVQRRFDDSIRGRLVLWALRRFADAVVVIDKTVAKRIPDSVPVSVIHNGLNVPSAVSQRDREHAKGMTPFEERPMRVAFVGNLLRLKGVVELVQAAKICSDKGMNIEFSFVGDIPRSNSGPIRYALQRLGLYEDLGEYLQTYVQENELQQRVKFLGFIEDVRKVYIDTDILCFPSHLNAVGRPTIEAALFKVPSIVAIRNPESDTMIHGETGLCIEEKSPSALADAIEYFYRNPREIDRMGEQAHQLAQEYFNIAHNAEKVLAIYRACLHKRSG